ncbi:unnamed protein product [Protopolystoma xenopodis]|uniref:Uncharacterized protein n=1 Tax=Protopolystoma xenopodis TaxID=117903 RepID=A0A3S5C036_9PLAT|nr:unnamed protein product [Protopolystoma xenopodis]
MQTTQTSWHGVTVLRLTDKTGEFASTEASLPIGHRLVDDSPGGILASSPSLLQSCA